MSKLKTFTINGKTYEIGGGSGASSWNDLEDKPFYVEHSEPTVILENENVPFTDMGDGSYAFMYEQPILEEGQTYKITWDGTEYVSVCQKIIEPESTNVMLIVGNGGLGGLGEDTGETFIIIDMLDAGVFAMGTIVTIEQGASHIVSIQKGGDIVHTLDPQFLPKDYIKELIDEYIGEALDSEV